MTEISSSSIRELRFSNATGSKTEVICGDVILQGPDKQRRYVNVKVYRTAFEHFAAVYPLKRLSRPIGVINLRNTRIFPIEDDSSVGFVVNQRTFDVTTSITLHCEPHALDAWMDAFTNRNSPTSVHQTLLPIVTEEEVD